MKVVTLAEAIASGRPFRRKSSDAYLPDGHTRMVGHSGWYIATGELKAYPGLRPEVLKCQDCGASAQTPYDQPDEWIIQKSEDEFEDDAQKILQKLGLVIKEPAL